MNATETTTKKKRLSGILVHPTSFPSPYGIGDLGQGAYAFIDFLEKSGQHLWQVLPLGPTGFGDSPYQGFSAFAGQPLIISPANLKELGLLSDADFADMPQWDPKKIDYGAVLNFKTELFHKAYANFIHTPDKMLLEEFEDFCLRQNFWLADYALFMAAKDAHEGRCWLEWEPELKDPDDASRKKWEKKLAEEIRYYQFLQFLFFRQWDALKEYANARSIEIIGDIPIFVSLDSVDVWAHKDLFQLDTKGYPTCVAGVPPDYFSATGQLWGNPLYDWKAHKNEDYAWWVARVKHQIALTDYLRIDHFRGFEAYWAVPAGEETAVNGEWVKGPNEELFLAIQKELGEDLPIFAEILALLHRKSNGCAICSIFRVCAFYSLHLKGWARATIFRTITPPRTASATPAPTTMTPLPDGMRIYPKNAVIKSGAMEIQTAAASAWTSFVFVWEALQNMRFSPFRTFYSLEVKPV